MPGKKYCAPEPPVTIETPVCVGRSAVKIKYAVAAAYSEKDAIDSAVRILIGEDEKNSYIDKTASRMKLTAGDIQRALKKVSALTFITDARKAAARGYTHPLRRAARALEVRHIGRRADSYGGDRRRKRHKNG